MAEPSKDTDQSMEDILQSIKRIIADEGEPTPPVAGSDVLELTELLAEDVATPQPMAAEETPAPAMSIEELMASSFGPSAATAPVPPPAEEVPPAMETAAPAPAPTPAMAEEPLMSDTTLSAALSALNALHHAPQSTTAAVTSGLGFRSGVTVEDLVLEALKPMLKEWLDGHLPALVSALVEKEIRRLGAH